MLLGLGLLLSLSACWKDEYATLPSDTFQFQPIVDAPAGWIVVAIDVNLECPDDEDARFYLLYPEEAADSGVPMPTAVFLHSGTFDYVFAPEASDPLAGAHFAVPSRLGREFSVRQVFATLGMYPSQIAGEDHLGLLPAVLADHGVAMMFPTNCWGDLWHNKPTFTENDNIADHFPRSGLTAAEYATQFVTDPLFAAAFDVELPIVTDPAKLYVVGLGEGGRAAAELLTIDGTDDDTDPDYTFAGALVDSPPDDLRVVYDDPGLYASLLEGLDRIFPPGVDATASGSFWAAGLPPRMGYAAPVDDPVWPDAVHDAAYTRIEAAGGWTVREDSGPLQLDGSDVGLAEQAVAFLLGES